jgi:hypothetical protein
MAGFGASRPLPTLLENTLKLAPPGTSVAPSGKLLLCRWAASVDIV